MFIIVVMNARTHAPTNHVWQTRGVWWPTTSHRATVRRVSRVMAMSGALQSVLTRVTPPLADPSPPATPAATTWRPAPAWPVTRALPPAAGRSAAKTATVAACNEPAKGNSWLLNKLLYCFHVWYSGWSALILVQTRQWRNWFAHPTRFSTPSVRLNTTRRHANASRDSSRTWKEIRGKAGWDANNGVWKLHKAYFKSMVLVTMRLGIILYLC